MTDKRLKASEPEKDPQLAVLMFQFGRYLLIASSRPGSGRGGYRCLP